MVPLPSPPPRHEPRPPLLQPLPAPRPLLRRDREDRRVPQPSVLTGCPRARPVAQDALEAGADALDRRAGAFVAGVRLQVDAGDAPLLEGVPEEQQLGL